MCGICGVVTMGMLRPDPPLLQKMVSTMRHRGPDDQGVFVSPDVGLGICRLAVLDVEGGHQPMSGRLGNCQVVFNGEIYNYPELRRELEAKGVRFKTRCDTEILAYLYEEEGEAFVKKLRGMFAIALWDMAQKKLILARDPIGVKPLYYSHLSDGSLIFGSEIKALFAVQPPPSVDRSSIVAFFSLLYIPSPQTIYEGIVQLPPAHTLVWQRGKIEGSQYWKLSYEKREWVGEEEAAEALRELLSQTVKSHLASDVPLGVFLSGGFDSSSVTAFMARHSSGPVKTFTLSFGKEAPSYNESILAKRVSQYFGATHTEMEVTPDLFSLLPKMIEHFDQPFADSSSLLTYLVSEMARNKVTVALTGIGGDELFGGYPRYQGVLLARWLEWLPRTFRRNLLAKMARFIPEGSTSTNPTGRIKRFLSATALSQPDRYLSWIRIVAPQELAKIFQPAFWSEMASFSELKTYHSILTQEPSLEWLDRVFRLDFKTYLPDDLLAMGDRMSMAHSLELRVPYCDPVLAQFSASLPARFKVRVTGLKILFKKAMRSLLPEELFSQPKRGFMMPLGDWLKTRFLHPCRDFLLAPHPFRNEFIRPEGIEQILLEHNQKRRNHGDLIFALMAFTQWCLLHQERKKRG